MTTVMEIVMIVMMNILMKIFEKKILMYIKF